MALQQSPGQILAAQLSDCLTAYRIGPVVGGHVRQIVLGVTPVGAFVGGMTVDGFITQAGKILRESKRFYRFGNSVVIETDEPGNQRLTTLAVQHRAEPNATAILANLVGVGFQTKEGTIQSLAAPKLINAVLADESLWRDLPEIRYHARRPTFDADFNLCRPGWNAGAGILIHAPEIIPAIEVPAYAAHAMAGDRLPPLLCGLLREFAWRSDADLVNALAMLMTGVLINHFVDDPHPGGIVDANQPGTGKTLLIQTFGRVLDDAEPPRISLVRDEELEKRLCAQLRSSRTSIFFLDNVRARIESMVLEQNMLSPMLSFRILGRSATIERPNTSLWMITSNMTAGTTDFIRRCVPIRQLFEGDPKTRVFHGNPLAYAAEHRLGILGELAGMVVRWVEQGKPQGTQKHRCDRWAATIGGILDVNGLGAFFLANADEAEAQMDQGLLDLATLAEHVIAKGLADLHMPAGGDPGGKGKAPGQWVSVVAETQVLRDKLVDAGPKGKATAVGMFLSGKVNRAVPVETNDGPRTATLRRREAQANQKLYFFEIAAPVPTSDPSVQSPPEASAATPLTSNGNGPASTAPVSGAVEVSGEAPGTNPLSPAPICASVASNGASSGSDLDWYRA